MRFLALGDTHLGLFTGRNAKAKKLMAKYAYQQFNYCIDQAIEKDVDMVFHTGDIFNRSQPPDWIIQHYYKAIERLLDHGIGLQIIPGNHDKARLQPSLIDHLYPKYNVYNRLGYDDIISESVTFRIIGIPYIYNNPDEVWKQVEKWVNDNEGPSIILTHQLFEGAWFGPQRFIFTKNKWKTNENVSSNRKGEEIFDVSNLPNRVQIISGHIHRSQTVQEGKVIYTGSTVRTSFAEMIEPKGYLLGEITEKGITINFEAIPTLPMTVFELRQFDFENLYERISSLQNPSRILIRLLDQKVDYHLIKKIEERFSADEYPFLQISPKTPGVVLKPLYTTYSDGFDNPSVKRSWYNKKSPKNRLSMTQNY